ncbi:hypothetical protein C8A03DRAFT_34555 [Achaetomium macrosporum]|uniref:Uncharacterized protein n=1 Tax=Achaetomium macrosporum TaxID=79813 RepID=A0AAN7HDH4_9PEZI|nr:hypothetical protein C8A03DRAFT_34555 [Achaetomium macrosporum]
MDGPPSVAIYWRAAEPAGEFNVIVISKANARAGCTNYLVSADEFLGKGLCKVHSLNATSYDVYVVGPPELPQPVFRDALGLL